MLKRYGPILFLLILAVAAFIGSTYTARFSVRKGALPNVAILSDHKTGKEYPIYEVYGSIDGTPTPLGLGSIIPKYITECKPGNYVPLTSTADM
jgi:hypothetical protein